MKKERTMNAASGVSRRQFLIGAGLAGLGAAGAGLAGCAPSGQAGAAAGKGTDTASAASAGGAADSASLANNPLGANAAVEWTFMTPPADIPADQITGTEDVDVLVVGCGFAGAIASVAAAQAGAKTLCIEKCTTYSGRGGHITAYGSKIVKQYVEEGWFKEADYAHIVRRLTEWATGRVKEPLLWQFAKKSGACMDWLVDLVADSGLQPTLWAGYYKGPDYTEEPITHFFYDDTTDFVYLDGVSKGLGMAVLIPAVIEQGEKLGVEYRYETPCARLLRDGDGPVTGAIVGDEGNYQQINAKSVIVATGDYLDDDEMRTRYQPFTWHADSRLYIPFGISTGDLHKQAMWIGGAMQPSEPHCATIHLESGAQSYNFLHVNKNGERFMNEDVNTQSKSCVKSYQPEGKAFTIYDANSLESFAQSCNDGISGGISSDQQYRRFGVPFDMDVELKLRQAKIDQGLLFQADTLDELAEKAGIDAAGLKATVARYNELAAKGNDDDFGKPAEKMVAIENGPFYLAKLGYSFFFEVGGIATDKQRRVLDVDSKPIPGLYAIGNDGNMLYRHVYTINMPGTAFGNQVNSGREAANNVAEFLKA